MAITIKVQPQLIQPVYNPIITVLDSTQKNKENFQFIIDVNIDGTAQSRMKIQLNPDSYGVLDLHKHIEPYVSYDITDPLTDLTEIKKASNSYTEYDITLSEEYIPTLSVSDIVDNGGGTVQVTTTTAHGAASGDSIKLLNIDVSAYDGTYIVLTAPTTSAFTITATYTSDATSGEYRLSSEPITSFTSSTVFTGSTYAFNGVENWVDFSTYTSDSFNNITNSLGGRLLTSLPNYSDSGTTVNDAFWNDAFEITSNSRMYLNFFDEDETYNECRIRAYDSNKTFIAFVDSDSIATGTTDNFVLRMAVGPWNINNSANPAGYGDNFLTGATYYSVVASNNESSKIYKFKIVDDCTIYETFQFLFLDRLGSFIPVTFNLLSRKNVGLVKTSYKKNSGSYNPTSNTWGYNTYDRGKTRLDTRVNETITVNSDWVSESKSNIINEMIASPEVYHIDENGAMLAIDILTAGYEVKTRLKDKVINHEINFEYSFSNAQQK